MRLPSDSISPTHEVVNQPPEPWTGNLAAGDGSFSAAVELFGGDLDALSEQAGLLGQDDMRLAGREANRHKPELVQFDRSGRRLDEVRYHPAYHRFMGAGLAAGYAAGPWTGGSHVTHAGLVYLHSQVEPGTCCPMTMTYAAVPALRKDAGLAATWEPAILSRHHDHTVAPVGRKSAATIGMAMTEKQGGSDVRANSTRAERDGAAYRLTGHKWFCSAPMSDALVTLAQAPGGLTCFLVPRWLDDRRNGIRLMRLKDKLGNISNASAEIEFDNALANRLGDEGDGVRMIIEMVHHTRLDTAIAPAGLMRAALAEALHWTEHRSAFQRRLIDQPLMRAVLADLAIDTQAALWLGMRVAQAFDRQDEDGRAFARIAVALAKYINNKRCPNVVYEAMEVMGGMGYVDDTPLPMLYREAPLNSIWEGSGNVICLDILRTLARDPVAAEQLQIDLRAARGQDARYDRAVDDFSSCWKGLPAEAEMRAYSERLAVLLTASVLIRHAPGSLAGAYVTSRVEGARGSTAGTVEGLDPAAILGK